MRVFPLLCGLLGTACAIPSAIQTPNTANLKLGQRSNFVIYAVEHGYMEYAFAHLSTGPVNTKAMALALGVFMNCSAAFNQKYMQILPSDMRAMFTAARVLKIQLFAVEATLPCVLNLLAHTEDCKAQRFKTRIGLARAISDAYGGIVHASDLGQWPALVSRLLAGRHIMSHDARTALLRYAEYMLAHTHGGPGGFSCTFFYTDMIFGRRSALKIAALLSINDLNSFVSTCANMIDLIIYTRFDLSPIENQYVHRIVDALTNYMPSQLE